MKRVLLLSAVLSLLLGGCSSLTRLVVPPADMPVVEVVDGSIVVVPEPLRFKQRGAKMIVWSLPSGYTFPDNGIVVEGEIVQSLPINDRDRKSRETIIVDRTQKEIVNCKPIANNTKFQCDNRNTRVGEYKYTIRALRNGQPLRPVDPHIYNE